MMAGVRHALRASLLVVSALSAATAGEAPGIRLADGLTVHPQPGTLPLGETGGIALPGGRWFLTGDQARAYLDAYRLEPRPADLRGVVLAGARDGGWPTLVGMNPERPLSDLQARRLDNRSLWLGLREGLRLGNAARVAAGRAPLELLDWAAEPGYDAAGHTLSWAMLVRRGGDPEDRTVLVACFRVGVRRGTVELTTIAGPGDLAGALGEGRRLAAALRLAPGEGYRDTASPLDWTAVASLVILVGGTLLLVGLFIAWHWKLVGEREERERQARQETSG